MTCDVVGWKNAIVSERRRSRLIDLEEYYHHRLVPDRGQESPRGIKLVSFGRSKRTLTDAGSGTGKATVLDFQEVDETPIDLLPGDAFLRRRHSRGRAPGHQGATDRRTWPISKGSDWWCLAVPESARVPSYADYLARASVNDTDPPWRICTRENASSALSRLRSTSWTPQVRRIIPCHFPLGYYI